MSLKHQIKDTEARLSNLLTQKSQVEQRMNSYRQSAAITTMATQKRNGVNIDSEVFEKYANAARKLQNLSCEGLKTATNEPHAIGIERENVNEMGRELLDTLLAILNLKREFMLTQKNRIIFCLSKLETAKNDEAEHLRMGYQDLADQTSKSKKQLIDMRKDILKQANDVSDYTEVAKMQAEFIQNELATAPLSNICVNIFEMINAIRDEYTTILKFNSGELLATSEVASINQQIPSHREDTSNSLSKNSKVDVMASSARQGAIPLSDDGVRRNILPQQVQLKSQS